MQEVVDAIATRGALVDLTDRGRALGAWQAGEGFCIETDSDVEDVTRWTGPATDGLGRVVARLTVRVVFRPVRLAGGSPVQNRFGVYNWVERTLVAVRFNDGWRVTEQVEE
ncbi:conserved protein of unknown function [Rhodovastum atsumiense]|uniref:Uncharacterized protein n=1 Tax=Rhodovastum atsumiense TaxID=504468 RepID=A0A5M6IME8_9PROT|nr:hypothetical protein [Rhodovastum atsumiense]KAA5609463.1 hypothetical protein F1189_24165 [Rhodovastum atsumiense]CAH2603547.1 conserved protein of unknown function [Rhodovastum atsumiense]